jgi:PBP1b-binding outer membrane lipoprotein LpoB
MKKLPVLLSILGLILILSACGNSSDTSSNTNESSNKIDDSLVQEMQGKWTADDSYPSTIEVDDKTIDMDSLKTTKADYTIVEAKDGDFKAEMENDKDHYLEGTVTSSAIIVEDDYGVELTFTRE